MQIKLRKECFYIYFSPLGFAQALHCNQKASHAVLGTLNAAPVRTAVLTERIKQVLQSYITLISTSPKSLLTDGDPRACCLELTTN